MNNLTPVSPMPAASTLTGLDWLAIAFYFSILLGVAWWVVKRRKDTAADYFLAGRNLSWWIIGASIFASKHRFRTYRRFGRVRRAAGVTMAHYELHAWCLLVLAWVFVPFYCVRWCSRCRSFWSGASPPLPATCSPSFPWSRS